MLILHRLRRVGDGRSAVTRDQGYELEVHYVDVGIFEGLEEGARFCGARVKGAGMSARDLSVRLPLPLLTTVLVLEALAIGNDAVHRRASHRSSTTQWPKGVNGIGRARDAKFIAWSPREEGPL
ncbi:hypothetical protein MRB53_040119 [Persea americana]|nr:hypothetical protein MRB53_040119 [Persea americana]